MSKRSTDRPNGGDQGGAPRRRHYLSIDVEDIVLAAADLYARTPPDGYRDNLGGDLRATLDVLAETGARATFFVNGFYGDQYGDLIREIVDRGHKLATHGHRHRDVRTLTVDEFRDDLKRSIDTLSKYQDRIIGYRPPAFTMPFDDAHLTALLDNGIRYVSCGALFSRTNVPHRREPARLDCGLVYIPVSMAYVLGNWVRYPVGYGHVSRLLPERLYLASLRWWVRRASFVQFYFHPYELGGLQPGQRDALIRVNRKDIPQRIYSRRCTGRSDLFRRIFNTCEFQPLESMEALANGEQVESRIRQV